MVYIIKKLPTEVYFAKYNNKNFISTTRVGIKYTFVSAITILLQILINCAGSTLFYSIALQYDYIIQFINSLFNRINL